jgi:hypothetical protein
MRLSAFVTHTPRARDMNEQAQAAIYGYGTDSQTLTSTLED